MCGHGNDYHVNERVDFLQLKHMQIVVFDNQCIIEGAKLRYNPAYQTPNTKQNKFQAFEFHNLTKNNNFNLTSNKLTNYTNIYQMHIARLKHC